MPQEVAASDNSGLKKSLSIAAAIMMGSVLLSRLLGIVREQVLAYFAGTSADMDAYVAAFLIPEFVNHLLAGGFMSITFIPIFQRHVNRGDNEAAWKTFSNLMSIGTVAMAVVIIFAMVFTESILGLMGKDINNPMQLALAVRLTRIVLPAQLFFFWGSLLMAAQFANHRFLVPALAPLLYNIGIMSCGWFFFGRLGVEGFAWGVLGGSFVGSFAVQLLGASRMGMKFVPMFDLKSADFRKYVLLTLPLMFGLGMQFSNEVFFRYFGSFTGQGGVASLNYSLRVMWALVGVFGQAFGVAAFPFISGLAAKKKFDEMNRLSYGVISRISTVIIPFSGIMMVFSHQIIAVLYQRGRFDSASTSSTAHVLVFYLIGAFAYAATPIVSRNFYAMQNTFLPMIVSSIIALCSIPCYYVLAGSLGTRGVALAASILMTLQLVVMLGIWTKRFANWGQLLGLGITLAKVVVFTVLGCLLCYRLVCSVGSLSMITGLGPLSRNLITGIVAGLPSLLIIFGLLDLFHISDFRHDILRLIGKERARGY